MKCPACNSDQTSVFLCRRQVPVHQNMLFRAQESAINCERGNLEITVCRDCGVVFNAAFEPTKLRYDAEYDNNQTYSLFFEKYVDDLIRELIVDKKLHHKTIVEVGCGKGYFLRKLVEIEDAKNIGYGFDPTYVGPEQDLGGRLRFEKRFYDAASSNISPDIVICRHVIEHVPEPIPFLRTIRGTLSGTSTAWVFFETPCVEWILSRQVIWDFFYEHCSYFSADSLTVAMERAGFKVQHVRRIFGEQYLWFEATTGTTTSAGNLHRADRIVQLCQKFGLQEGQLVAKWRTKLGQLSQTGAVALWGAGAKGVTLANLVDPDRKLIACVVDLNPHKQGGFVPGTGHPIVSYLDLHSFQVKSAIQMNPNYAIENSALLRDARLTVALIDPTSWQVVE